MWVILAYIIQNISSLNNISYYHNYPRQIRVDVDPNDVIKNIPVQSIIVPVTTLLNESSTSSSNSPVDFLIFLGKNRFYCKNMIIVIKILVVIDLTEMGI